MRTYPFGGLRDVASMSVTTLTEYKYACLAEGVVRVDVVTLARDIKDA